MEVAHSQLLHIFYSIAGFTQIPSINGCQLPRLHFLMSWSTYGDILHCGLSHFSLSRQFQAASWMQVKSKLYDMWKHLNNVDSYTFLWWNFFHFFPAERVVWGEVFLTCDLRTEEVVHCTGFGLLKLNWLELFELPWKLCCQKQWPLVHSLKTNWSRVRG